jgi:uncharacterized protein
VDVLIVSYGARYSPLEEPGEEIRVQLEQLGYGNDAIARAHRELDAVAAVRATDLRAGFEELARVKRKYGGEPWLGIGPGI